jgi:site-specific recombinase XerD
MLLQDFFLQRLGRERGSSPRTIASYRDTFELLLRFVEEKTRKVPTDLTLPDLDAPMILEFLDYIEKERSNAPQTRNVRLAAIHSFMRYASVRDPASIAVAQRVLAIPSKRFDRPILGYLSIPEINAILNAPDRTTWNGRRDAALLETLYNTGARVSEITGLKVSNILLDRESAIHLHGKGRKQRVVPLWKSTAGHLRDWLTEIERSPDSPVFPNRSRKPLTRSGVQSRLRLAVAKAVKSCPSLQGRQISPHTIRHTTAMHLLQAGVALPVIALWLGHESTETTHGYIEADLAMKEKALKKIQEPPLRHARFRASDPLLAFLERL